MKLADKNFKMDFTTMPNDSRQNVYNEWKGNIFNQRKRNCKKIEF